MKVAVTGVLHTHSKIYYNDYIKSIYNQSYKDFDLILFSHKVNDMRSIYLEPKLSPSEAKKFTLDYIKNMDYDIVIFTDTDDFFHKDYIKELVNSLKTSGISFTDVNLFFKNKILIENYFDKCNVPDVVDLKYIEDKNCIGFGNSGIQLNLYHDMGTFLEQFNICDWWFFKNLMKINNCSSVFIRKGLVYYRQHVNNVNYLDINKLKLWNEK